MTLTFETKVWENDWEYILKGDYLNKMISNCDCSFDKKNIIINNVTNKIIVEKHCKSKIKEGIIDAYYFVDEYSKTVLNHFNIDIDSFNGGYVYSISELLGIYICETDFLLHFSSDSFLERNNNTWIYEAIEIMNSNSNIIVANPTWNYKYSEAKSESINELGNFYIASGFSDQCYLIKTNEFKKNIYNEKNILSERYPNYGGELFEKRVDAFMRNNNKLRITHMLNSYVSKNFPNYNWVLKKLFRKYILQQRFKQLGL